MKQWIRQAEFRPKPDADREAIMKYFMGICTHSMYRPLVEDVAKISGFVAKELVIIDEDWGTWAVNRVIFSSQEGLDTYTANEAWASTWEYLKIMADQVGLDCTVSTAIKD
jgi:hypothetical protein